MAEYHVGCGLFGIYAGVVNKPRKDGLQTWRSKSNVTEEAINAVAEWIEQEMNREMETEREYTFRYPHGNVLHLVATLEKAPEEEE